MEVPTLTTAPVDITHENEALRLVVYGDPGVGKTTLAMTFPKPLVLNADNGLVAVTVKAAPKKSLGKKVKVDGYQDLMGLFFYARDHRADWETFVVDGLDELAFLLTDELIERDNEYEKRKRGDGYNPRPSQEFIPEQPEYLANQRQLHTFLTKIAGLGGHVVVTLGVRDIDPPKIRKRMPNLAPGAAKDLLRWSSVTGELVIADDGRGLIVRNGDPVRESKTRFEALHGAVIKDPTFDTLWTGIVPATKGAK